MSLSRSETNTTPFDWLDIPIVEMIAWYKLIEEVAKEDKARNK